jgi:hypothetical protein
MFRARIEFLLADVEATCGLLLAFSYGSHSIAALPLCRYFQFLKNPLQVNSASQLIVAVRGCDIYALRVFLDSMGFWRNAPASQAEMKLFQRIPFVYSKNVGALAK